MKEPRQVPSTVDMVRQFHEKHDFPADHPLESHLGKTVLTLDEIRCSLEDIASDIKTEALERQAAGDERLYRMYLMIEELAEVADGLYKCDNDLVLDGLADLRYVSDGTAVTYGLPLEEGVQEVQRSNMTKKVRDKVNDPRMRNKGPDYVPPNLKAVLEKYRIVKEA